MSPTIKQKIGAMPHSTKSQRHASVLMVNAPKSVPNAEAPKRPPIASNRNQLRMAFGNDIRLTGRMVKNKAPALKPCNRRPMTSAHIVGKMAAMMLPSKNMSTRDIYVCRRPNLLVNTGPTGTHAANAKLDKVDGTVSAFAPEANVFWIRPWFKINDTFNTYCGPKANIVSKQIATSRQPWIPPEPVAGDWFIPNLLSMQSNCWL